MHPDEQRYIRIFQNIDLTSNFYFSYSYDLTHSLQFNLMSAKTPQEKVSKLAGDIEAVRSKPNLKFVWNAFFWKEFSEDLHKDWVMYVTHGFCQQTNVSVFGRPIIMTLIARRSNQYAGTRFLKRGINREGNVANEVETEQIVYDGTVTKFSRGRYTSFIQLRGSVPSFWSQDISNMVPKPPITVDKSDPLAHGCARHFNEVLSRYGAPVIVLNLVKKREKRIREGILSSELLAAISYLNQFLPPKHTIEYVAVDMARLTKSPKHDVIETLHQACNSAISRIGFFACGYGINSAITGHQHTNYENLSIYKQTGVLRTNCVDCLDRTNTAQFVAGKIALSHQLYCLGVLDKVDLEFDSDILRMLEDMYEDHGDTLAVQYGGSQLVHSIRDYRRLSLWTSHSRDIKQTMSRYFSNAFSDAEKQSAINLFLGIYQPLKERVCLWDLSSDYYLHHKSTIGKHKKKANCYTNWLSEGVLRALPFSRDEVQNSVVEYHRGPIGDDHVDVYTDLYRPTDLTSLETLFYTNMIHSIRDFMPKNASCHSPFEVRVQPKRGQERSTLIQQPILRQVSAASFVTQEGSSTSDDASSSDDGTTGSSQELRNQNEDTSYVSFKDLFSTMKETYGVEISSPNRPDVSVYHRFVKTEVNSRIGCIEHLSPTGKSVKRCLKRCTRLLHNSAFSLDSSYHVTPPTVSRLSKALYEENVQLARHGAKQCSRKDLNLYKFYVRQMHL
ncbi:polyphosphoinositide phosphatase-like [Anneissia japonica]|uniref:polyphosphoinositide phosphatase-like n=1 Tax=Anneissia japonica TaxID=1529436 RepID=UPI0014257D13|nr:polyphosphoinositide phosphatase-like [Anneissia japonica]